MNASFPYVSPAVNLPSVPPLRVVDAGYYDNYGVDIAAAWLFANRLWIEDNTSGVLVVQIRDSLGMNDRFRYPIEAEDTYASILRGLQFFFSPVDAVASARSASSSFRNDALIAGLSDYFSERTGKREFLTTAIFELASRTVMPFRESRMEWPGDRLDLKIGYADSSQSTEVAMSWYLSVAERQAIDMAIPHIQAPDDFILDTQIPFGEGTDGTNLAKTLGLDNGLAGQFQVPSIDVKDPVQRTGRADKLRDIRQLIQEKVTDVTSLRERRPLRARQGDCPCPQLRTIPRDRGMVAD